MNPDGKTAGIAGLWYLAIAVLYSFSMIYVDSAFFVRGDVEATVKNIQASGLVFRLGFVACLVGHVCFLFLADSLYRLFRPVDGNLARLMVIFVIAGVSVAFLGRLNQAAAVLLLSGEDYLSVFETSQLNALAVFFLDVHRHGGMMATLFWGLWLLPLGLLSIKSGFIPGPLGILLIGACMCYLTDFSGFFFFPRFMAVIDVPLSVVETVAEVAFIVWLLVLGVRKRKTADMRVPG